MNRHAALTLGLAIVLALSTAGAVRADATAKSPAVTTKVMVAGLKAIQYPVAHPKKLTCRGRGAAVKGRHTSFRCVATMKAHRQRRFYTRSVAEGGWMCAGKRLSRCAMLSHGFVPASAADNQGWQAISVLGWLQAHHVKSGVASVSCTGIRSPMTCTLTKKPAVTVVLAYQKVRGGYVETATRRPG
jgi:hypothetical protein